MSLKSVVKKILPSSVEQRIRQVRERRREQRMGRLSIQEAFDEVYRSRIWQLGNAASGPGSEGLPAQRYIQLVQEYASRHALSTVVDGGCGDFSIGSKLAASFGQYTAFDVSPRIIQANQMRYAELARKNVSFGVADMTANKFPDADLILIRQVLQHLTNAQIEAILKNLEASTWRRALITEEVCDPRQNPKPNLDLPSHTFGTRVARGSGVFIDREPFNRKATRMAIIDDVVVGGRPLGTLMVFELSRDPAAFEEEMVPLESRPTTSTSAQKLN